MPSQFKTYLIIIFYTVTATFFINDAHAEELLISNITVINPVDNSNVKTLKHQWVEINDGRITQISSTPLIGKNHQRVIDGTDKYLIPGLMDAHVHTGTMPGLLYGSPNAQSLQAAFLKQQPRSYLYYGITQILDPSRTPASVAMFNENPVTPDLFHCGAIPIIGGYTLFVDSVAEAMKRRKYFIYQPEKDGAVPKGFDAAKHTPEAVVAQIAKDGAQCVKVYTEDGFDTASHWPTISAELLSRVRLAANKHGLKMMAHANAVDMQKTAIDASVDVLGHGMWNWLELPIDTPELPAEIKVLADRIVAKKMTYQPTLNVMRSLRDVTVEGHLEHSDYHNVIPKQTMQWYKSKEGQWFANEDRKRWGKRSQEHIHQHMTNVINQGARVLQYLYQQGHPMVLATDTPPAPTYASQPGVSAKWELEKMHSLGVSLPHLLAAATINNAIAFGLNDDYGSIDVGKVANLLVLTHNPLEDIAAYDHIESVILHGKAHQRSVFKVKN